MLGQYIPMIWLFGLATAAAVAILVLKPKSVGQAAAALTDKPDVSEAGAPKHKRERYSARFYLAAATFVVFEVAMVFIIPWAMLFKDLFVGTSSALVGLGMMLGFMAIVTLGLVYQWKGGSLEWD